MNSVFDLSQLKEVQFAELWLKTFLRNNAILSLVDSRSILRITMLKKTLFFP